MERVVIKVTSEISTSWWVRLLRFLKLKPKREEFYLEFPGDPGFFPGDTLFTSGDGVRIKIISIQPKIQIQKTDVV
jgi:hypothetical protein